MPNDLDSPHPVSQGRQSDQASALTTPQLAGLFCLAYWACAKGGQYLSVPAFPYITFWLPAGLYMGVLLLQPTRQWPWFIAASTVANLAFDIPHGTPFFTVVGFCCGNTLQAVTGAWLMRRFVAERPNLRTLKELIGLAGYSAGLSTILGATIGAATLVWSGLSPSFFSEWKSWWSDELMSILLMTPFVLCWFNCPVTRQQIFQNRAKIVEALLLLAGLGIYTWYMLVNGDGILSPYKSRFMPFLLWAGLRFGLRGVTAANLLFALWMAFLTTHFVKGLTPEQVAAGSYVSILQSCVAMTVLISLVPAVVLLERDRNLRRLKESEERFRQLTDASFEGICITENGRLVDVNDQALKMLGYTRAEVIGQELIQYLSPDTRAAAGAIQSGDDLVHEHRLLRKDGTAFDAEAHAKMVRLDNREVRITAIRDITERKQAEQARIRLTQQLQLLLESSGEGIYGTDVNGNCTFANRAGAEMVGRKPADLLGKNMHEMCHHHRVDGSPYPVEECPVAQAFKAGIRCRVDHEVFWRQDGTSFPVEYASYPLIESGKITGAVVTFVDITQRRKLEEQLRQSQKMEAIGRLAGGVAHDFNNILAAMMMEADLAGMIQNLPVEARNSLRELKASAERAANLTRQLVVFSRKQVMHTRSLDVNQVVSNLTIMLHRIVGEDVHIFFKPCRYPAFIRGDAGMLEQVLLNLVVNARDAMTVGGRLDIAVTEKEVKPTDNGQNPDLAPGHYVRLTVADNGCGISPENLPHIFEPFFTTKEIGKGTGLGLATVFGIVKQHGGVIQVESEVGRGSTFHILLPAREPEEQSVTERESSSKLKPLTGTETILLVEDEPSVRVLTQTVLQRHGYKVIEAAHGVEALRLWDKHDGPIHLLFTDIVMPHGINGRELAEQLQLRNPALRVIFTSGYSADIAGRELALQTGQNFIPKPSSASEILRIVRQCLDG